jgi:hypothetical protein
MTHWRKGNAKVRKKEEMKIMVGNDLPQRRRNPKAGK